MGLRSLLNRLRARFRPGASDSTPEPSRAVPRYDLLELWEGVPDELAGEVLEEIVRDFEEDMAELEDTFRGRN